MTTQPTHETSEMGDAARTGVGRVKMAWFEHGASRIYYEEQGSGTPVLVLPGFAGSIEEFAALREAIVAAGYRVIAADLPGSGRSEPQPRVRTPPPTMRRMHARLRPCSSILRLNRHT